MASKTISVTEEVYNLLKSMKLPDESFGDVIKRLCEDKLGSNLLQWLEAKELWSDMSSEEYDELVGTISESKISLQKVDI